MSLQKSFSFRYEMVFAKLKNYPKASTILSEILYFLLKCLKCGHCWETWGHGFENDNH